MKSLAEQIIVDILTEEMQLPADTIWIRDQNQVIPNDSRLYVTVGFVDGQMIGTEAYQGAVDILEDPENPYFSDDAQKMAYFDDDAATDRLNSQGGFIN
ncbi:MAG: hypothetical protein ACRD36_13835, partial [Candidatus Acidiferrum sp.]